MGKWTDLTGKRFSLLTVVEYVGSNRHKQSLWKCVCDCGGEKIVKRMDLVYERVKSCGCIYRKKDRFNHIYNRLYKMKIREANSRGISFNIGYDLFNNLISQNCFYCGAEPNARFEDIYRGRKMSNAYFKHNGLDRVDSNRGYEVNNVVPCCTKCNYMKLAMTRDEFIEQVDKIHEHYHSDFGVRLHQILREQGA